jgi:hypothetical protein
MFILGNAPGYPISEPHVRHFWGHAIDFGSDVASGQRQGRRHSPSLTTIPMCSGITLRNRRSMSFLRGKSQVSWKFQRLSVEGLKGSAFLSPRFRNCAGFYLVRDFAQKLIVREFCTKTQVVSRTATKNKQPMAADSVQWPEAALRSQILFWNSQNPEPFVWIWY